MGAADRVAGLGLPASRPYTVLKPREKLFHACVANIKQRAGELGDKFPFTIVIDSAVTAVLIDCCFVIASFSNVGILTVIGAPHKAKAPSYRFYTLGAISHVNSGRVRQASGLILDWECKSART